LPPALFIAVICKQRMVIEDDAGEFPSPCGFAVVLPGQLEHRTASRRNFDYAQTRGSAPQLLRHRFAQVEVGEFEKASAWLCSCFLCHIVCFLSFTGRLSYADRCFLQIRSRVHQAS
jgi:hypothetical protein